MKCSECQGDGFVRTQVAGDDVGIDHRACGTCALAAANEKYKGIARITHYTPPGASWYAVYRSDGWLHETCDNLEDAIEACKWLDNAEPEDREI